MRLKALCFMLIVFGYSTVAYAMPVGYEEIQIYGKEIVDAEEYMEERKIDIPLEVSEACEKYGAEYNILPEIGEALCWRESRCTADANNGSCKGIAQINVNVHKGRMDKLGVKDIYDVDGNIHVAYDYLNDLIKDNNDIAKSLDAYNGNGMNGKSKYTKEILTVASILDRGGE